MIEALVQKDIDKIFESLKKPSDTQQIYVLWELLLYCKNKDLFNKDFYEYWLIKTISLPENFGLFVLSIKEITRDICGINALDLGVLIKDILMFNLAINRYENVTLILNYSLQGGVFFNKETIRHIVEKLDLVDDGSMMFKNIENEKIFLDNILEKK